MNWKYHALIIIFCVTGSTVRAQISPGKLARPHADLEGITNCTKCHKFGGGVSTEKCLNCHGEIKWGIQQKSGYHFQVSVKQGRICAECHSDHNGRNFELIFWPKGKKGFDHAQTGFLLEGKHAQLDCETCHQAKHIVTNLKKWNSKIDLDKTFLGLGTACLDCHRDEHQGQLSRNCLKCHDQNRWKPVAKFSHDRTRFPLTGLHRTVQCSKCHPNVLLNRRVKKPGKRTFVKFVGLQFANCTPCHQDVHRGRFGTTCTKCHQTTGWNNIVSGNFNHDLTRFPLVGLHKRVACQKCHSGNKFGTPMRFARCSDCHRDVHFGQFTRRKDGGRCESCHDVFGFVPAKFGVKEHANSGYPLTGAHLAVACVECHVVVDRGTPRERRLFRFKSTACSACHADVHKGQFAARMKNAGCEVCHQTSRWQETKFDHNTARFVLIGKHAGVPCRQCHKKVDVGSRMERILFRPMQRACSACHQDVHHGQFDQGERRAKCDRCHTSLAWNALAFDHNRDSLFRLTGAHEKVPCSKCHKEERAGASQFVRYKPIDKRCVHCHG